jgi:hypothetical protein
LTEGQVRGMVKSLVETVNRQIRQAEEDDWTLKENNASCGLSEAPVRTPFSFVLCEREARNDST